MVDHSSNAFEALIELENFVDSIDCCKLLASSISENEKELWESTLKFILYLSIKQHILFEGSVPDIYENFGLNMKHNWKEVLDDNIQVTIRVMQICFLPYLYLFIFNILTCRY